MATLVRLPPGQLPEVEGHVVLIQRALQQRQGGLTGGVGHLDGARLGGGGRAGAVGQVGDGLHPADGLQRFGHVLRRAAKVIQHPVHVVGAVQVVGEVGENVVVRVDLGADGRGQLAALFAVGVQRHHGSRP